MAERIGVKFDNVQFQPIAVADADGVLHTFDIQSMLVGTGHEMIAREITKADEPGYCFAVLGDFEADAWELFQRLASGRSWRNVTFTKPSSVGS
jgi:hypothetical protein